MDPVIITYIANFVSFVPLPEFKKYIPTIISNMPNIIRPMKAPNVFSS